jgi:hypothetical protein
MTAIPFDVNDDKLREAFFDQLLADYIACLGENTPPLWGKMIAQHMIEHSFGLLNALPAPSSFLVAHRRTCLNRQRCSSMTTGKHLTISRIPCSARTHSHFGSPASPTRRPHSAMNLLTLSVISANNRTRFIFTLYLAHSERMNGNDLISSTVTTTCCNSDLSTNSELSPHGRQINHPRFKQRLTKARRCGVCLSRM